MILYGASGHAKVILDICRLNQIFVSAIWDDNREILALLDLPVESPSKKLPEDERMIVSVGDNMTRYRIVKENNYSYSKVVHPSSKIDATVEIGAGTAIMAGTVINSSTRIGSHCIVNSSASVDHDCVLENFVHISPNATVCGGISIGEGTQIGAGATILPNLKIGKWSKIGAGSVVISDVPDGCTVVGNPARIIKTNNDHVR